MHHSMKNSLLILLLCFIFTGCKKNTDLFKFDTTKSTIYFDYALPTAGSSIATAPGIDSMSFSFALMPLTETKHVFKIPVMISGTSRNYDRSYQVEVVDSLTTLPAKYFSIGQTIIKKDSFTDTLEVTVTKHEELRSEIQQLGLRIKPNKEFEAGYFKNQTFRVKVSDILLQPDWWEIWEGVFGPYSQEKYQMWANIYHEKADGYLDYLYNYKNMPARPLQAWYPTTFVFIQQLQAYFEKHIVHPNGDTSKPRITIPYQF